jgi:malate synthase
MAFDSRMNAAPAGFDPRRDLPAGFWDFYLPLHQKFTPWRDKLVAARAARLAASQEGEYPHYLLPSEITRSEWRVNLPEWVLDQRNQMTGPVDDAELSVKMLNSGAPGVMLDLEDSMANTWGNLMEGHANAVAALYGDLSWCCKGDEALRIKPSKTVIFVRARGLHLSQAGTLPNGELTSASAFDVALLAFRAERGKLKHNLSFYIPKTESADEGKWWTALFQDIAAARGWERDYIKAMALVESFPMAYEFEEFLYHMREHILGLNLGRWDYMASLIHFNLNDPNWVLPDRNTIPHDVTFFQNLRLRIPQLCHRHGALAIGGMTALYPSRVDAELNARALKVLAEDKKNEAVCGMDGAWTGHPDQNRIALEQFPVPNQLGKWDPAYDRYPELRVPPAGVGRRTVDGSRAAARTTILYRFGVLSGKGASLINGYMEDLATDRIYRLMLAQRIRHAGRVAIEDNGKTVDHTAAFVSRLYDEELEKILAALPPDADAKTRDRYREARRRSEEMIAKCWFDPV